MSKDKPKNLDAVDYVKESSFELANHLNRMKPEILKKNGCLCLTRMLWKTMPNEINGMF